MGQHNATRRSVPLESAISNSPVQLPPLVLSTPLLAQTRHCRRSYGRAWKSRAPGWTCSPSARSSSAPPPVLAAPTWAAAPAAQAALKAAAASAASAALAALEASGPTGAAVAAAGASLAVAAGVSVQRRGAWEVPAVQHLLPRVHCCMWQAVALLCWDRVPISPHLPPASPLPPSLLLPQAPSLARRPKVPWTAAARLKGPWLAHPSVCRLLEG